ncbi:MAG TPA: asparagine synthase-related protein [Candidatus Acidoferrum sp.]|nr:asparagine synthase-related protein [Candidatus Acidoferrum sp.]
MSGVVGIFQRDGAPVERALLESLTHSLAYRGPDGQEVWADGSVAFGHALLRTTAESLGESQPASLDRRYWITADARIDCRAELESQLASAGRKCRRGAPDPELLLHAYAAWGEACVQHLRGDFAFAIWDARERALFCARDHFGLKPFYYADLGDSFFFSNTLGCLRLIPEISEELNDLAIADFLLFGANYDLASTAFREIRRLPPAHFLKVSADGLRVERYWSPPVDGRVRYRHADEYVEHFQVLLQAAVADRLRTSRAGILLSGGLDSSSIAATARGLSLNSGGVGDLRAYTITYESLLPDRDGEHARDVAEFLKIPIRCLPMDSLQLFERWTDPEFTWPEPVEDPFFAGFFDQMHMIAQDCRVVLNGEGIDNLMHFEMWPYARHLMRNREWRRLAFDSARYLRSRPSVLPGIQRRVRAALGDRSNAYVFPRWLAPELVKRFSLEERWRECTVVCASPAHPVVPTAHASLLLPQWAQLFELEDVGVTHCPVEVRYPFLDLRIVNYVLALPPFPWAFEKALLREAMLGHLPEKVRMRKKTPLAGDPLVENLRRPGAAWIEDPRWSREIDRYVNRSALPRLYGETDSVRASVGIRALCLNFWLQSPRGVRYNLNAEVHNG